MRSFPTTSKVLDAAWDNPWGWRKAESKKTFDLSVDNEYVTSSTRLTSASVLRRCLMVFVLPDGKTWDMALEMSASELIDNHTFTDANSGYLMCERMHPTVEALLVRKNILRSLCS